jgi:hypothetical protein
MFKQIDKKYAHFDSRRGAAGQLSYAKPFAAEPRPMRS